MHHFLRYLYLAARSTELASMNNRQLEELYLRYMAQRKSGWACLEPYLGDLIPRLPSMLQMSSTELNASVTDTFVERKTASQPAVNVIALPPVIPDAVVNQVVLPPVIPDPKPVEPTVIVPPVEPLV